jgi:glyoxylase-like metal-dependent hydrolase (beta-lactamase superfamily II)
VDRWQEVGDRVFVRRYAFFDQDIGAVVGEGAVLVIDTRTTYAQARELQDDLRALSPHPVIVVNTHFHFDHTFGNALFRPAEIWGHVRCAVMLRSDGERMRRAVAGHMPDLAAELDEVEIVPPDRTVGDRGTIDVGGRPVHLRYLGRGHTDNDLVVLVPDASVAFAGDLIEQGAPPSFGDSFPLDWPETLRASLPLLEGAVVPGHGDVVDRAFVETQMGEIAAADDVVRAAHAEGANAAEAASRIAFPPAVARDVAERGYLQLGALPPPDDR